MQSITPSEKRAAGRAVPLQRLAAAAAWHTIGWGGYKLAACLSSRTLELCRSGSSPADCPAKDHDEASFDTSPSRCTLPLVRSTAASAVALRHCVVTSRVLLSAAGKPESMRGPQRQAQPALQTSAESVWWLRLLSAHPDDCRYRERQADRWHGGLTQEGILCQAAAVQAGKLLRCSCPLHHWHHCPGFCLAQPICRRAPRQVCARAPKRLAPKTGTTLHVVDACLLIKFSLQRPQQDAFGTVSSHASTPWLQGRLISATVAACTPLSTAAA